MSLFGEQGQPQKAAQTITEGGTNVLLDNVPCDSSVSVGDVVKMVGGVAYRALADSEANSNSIGICQSKSSSVLCVIRVAGVSDAIYTGLDEAYEYFLSDTVLGGLTTTVPTLTGHVVLRIGQPYSSTRLMVSKGTRMVRT